MKIFAYLIISLVALAPLFSSRAAIVATGSFTPTEVNHAVKGAINIGAIVDYGSRPGKEAKVAMDIAIHDFFNSKTNQSNLVLHFRNSQSKPAHAAHAAKELIEKHDVKAILGAHTWEEAFSIAETINSTATHNLPLLSFVDSTPPWATARWPFLVQTTPTQHTQMKAVTAIVHSWQWQQITLIYEDTHSFSSSASEIFQLSQAFRRASAELTHVIPITSFSSLVEELEMLKREQQRIFVVYTSLELGLRLFQTAKKMRMTEADGYAWIATVGITDHLHSINPSIVPPLKGVLGVKSYFPRNSPEFQDFRKRFRAKFRMDYPDEETDEPGIFAVQAYDSVKMVSSAILHGRDSTNKTQKLFAPVKIVEIVNVIGKSYNRGYWTDGLGFSETVDDGATYDPSMQNLERVFWPAGPWYTQNRRRILASGNAGKRLKVGVPGKSLFRQFVYVDPQGNKTFDGFAIAVFEEVMRSLPYDWPYDFVAYNGSYDALVEQIHLEEFDAVAGDVTISASRLKHADFTQPFTESGLEMIVPVRSGLSNRTWLFLKPFTKDMWGLIVAITIYNGFTVWLIERSHFSESQGSFFNQIGILIWLAFTSLFTLHGEKLHSNLSRMSLVVWLFVALIITQSYTANLSSMLTAQRLEPAINDVQTLKNRNAKVGYCSGSFVGNYLQKVLDFKSVNTKKYSSTEAYAQALNTGEIAAIFLEVPPAKLFLDRYCRSFTRAGETFKVGGFGFAFRKNYSSLPDINKALLNVSENGKLRKLEEQYIVTKNCVDVGSDLDADTSLSPNSFWVLFGISGGISTVSLAIYAIVAIRELQESVPELILKFFTLMLAMIKKRRHQRRQFSSRVSNVESPRSPPNASNPFGQV